MLLHRIEEWPHEIMPGGMNEHYPDIQLQDNVQSNEYYRPYELILKFKLWQLRLNPADC